MGCIFSIFVAWISADDEGLDMPANDSQFDKWPWWKADRTNSHVEVLDWIEKEDCEAAQRRLEELRAKSDPVTQAVCDQVIADMLNPPLTRSTPQRLWDDAKKFIREGWNDYRMTLLKATRPLQKWALNDRKRSRNYSVSSCSKENGSVTSHRDTESDGSWNNDDEATHQEDQGTNTVVDSASPRSIPDEQQLARFLLDERDYKSYSVPEFDWIQKETKELHMALLESTISSCT